MICPTRMWWPRSWLCARQKPITRCSWVPTPRGCSSRSLRILYLLLAAINSTVLRWRCKACVIGSGSAGFNSMKCNGKGKEDVCCFAHLQLSRENVNCRVLDSMPLSLLASTSLSSVVWPRLSTPALFSAFDLVRRMLDRCVFVFISFSLQESVWVPLWEENKHLLGNYACSCKIDFSFIFFLFLNLSCAAIVGMPDAFFSRLELLLSANQRSLYEQWRSAGSSSCPGNQTNLVPCRFLFLFSFADFSIAQT